ncbi:MAG: tetratricopeptide repeat protein [Panacagrimonas sp.]
MLDSSLGWLLFPLGTALGFYLARRTPGSHVPRQGSSPIEGISTLASDDPDQAVAALLSVEELTEETVELHLTFGSLFRRRGQVDRALRVHEGLLARHTLSEQQRNRTEFELAEDYLKAGVLDRAERIYAGLADRGHKLLACLEAIVGIHENSHDWPQAIEVSAQLESASGMSRRAITAQYYCELADKARQAKQPGEAIRLAKQALSLDKACARACLLIAKLAHERKDWSEATTAYARVAEQESKLIPEIVQPLWACCRDWGRPEYFVHWMEDLPDDQRMGVVDVVRAELLRETGLDPAAYLLDAFEARPTWSVLEKLAELDAGSGAETLARVGSALRSATRTLGASRQKYQCQSCGMKPAQLFWHCPSCKQWGTVFPLDDRLAVRFNPLP